MLQLFQNGFSRGGTDSVLLDDRPSSCKDSRPKEEKSAESSLLSFSFIVNVGGIYACFMACSLLHEAIYRTRSSSGEAISPWFVNVLEALANVIVAGAGIRFWEGSQPLVPQWGMAKTGCLQVFAKYCASSSRLNGVPAPVLTLVKSARPLPVMLGQTIIAGVSYTPREYFQYLLVVLASVMVGAARSPLPSDEVSLLGMTFLLMSTLCDGYVGGRQKEMKSSVRAHRKSQGSSVEELQPFELQFYTNAYMLVTAAVFAICTGDFMDGVRYVQREPELAWRLSQYVACSAVGQIFIFACVAKFDPLVLAVVTTSRKLASVMATLIVFRYEVGYTVLSGLLMAGAGFYMILTGEIRRIRPKAQTSPDAGVDVISRSRSSQAIERRSPRSRISDPSPQGMRKVSQV